MVLKDVTVSFNKQNPVYIPGETIFGNLSFLVNSSKQVKVSEIYIKFNGIGKVSWSVSDSTGDSSDTTTYSAKEIYFKVKYDILKQTELSSGNHSYKFSFYLPKDIPSSFKGQLGEISYILKVRARIPWKLTYKYELQIRVVPNLKMDSYPLLKIPHQIFLERTYTSCCTSGETNVEITFPRTVYYSGEVINVTVNLENHSNVAVKDIVFKLRKTVEYIANFPRTLKNKEVLTIQKIHSRSILDGASMKKFVYNIPLPEHMEVYDLTHCGIIHFNYILFITVQLGGLRSLNDSVPLIILNKDEFI